MTNSHGEYLTLHENVILHTLLVQEKARFQDEKYPFYCNVVKAQFPKTNHCNWELCVYLEALSVKLIAAFTFSKSQVLGLVRSSHL